MAEFLRFSFSADYRRDGTVNVNATATTQQAALVCDEPTRQKLIALREAIRAAVPGSTGPATPEGDGHLTRE